MEQREMRGTVRVKSPDSASLHSGTLLELVIEDYELASAFYNTCRRKDVQGANTNFLICAASARRSYDILTTDKDFDIFS